MFNLCEIYSEALSSEAFFEVYLIYHIMLVSGIYGFSGCSDGKESASIAGDQGLIPDLERYTLEKEMVTHSSILAWRISWTEKPGQLQSIGSQRVGHD